MTDSNLDSIASKINALAKTHPIGMLQEIRKNLKGLERLPTHDIFTSQTTKEKWAFHHGGRRELQFNIGIEQSDDGDELRYGVAFSFETSQTLPKIDELVRKARFFNEYIQLYPEQFAGMRMRYHQMRERSAKYIPSSIPPELATEGAFIFLGQWQTLEQIDFEALLNCFDNLLPLYKYVESKGSLQLTSTLTRTPFNFHPGLSLKASSATASLAAKELDINLRHNVLQEALSHKLVEKYGADNVRVEQPSGVGTSIDIVVRHGGKYYFYEIKTEHSPRACLRQALGQLLEYSFWPGSREAVRLVIVGESPLDEDGAVYLRTLKKRFALPVEYEQIVVY